nr:ankyrin-3-like [Procambarus clarkii]
MTLTPEAANVDLLFALNEASAERAAEAIAAGADVNMKSSWGATPLHIASLRGVARLIQLLLSRGAKLDVTESEGFTPLMVAALNGHTDAVRTLVVNGADPHATRLDSGETALHMAMNSNSRGMVIALLDAGADVNALTSDKSTPLHVAAELNAQHGAEALLSHPACEIILKNSSGKTADQVARDHEHYSLAEYLDMCSSPFSERDKMLVSAVLARDADRAAEAVAAGANVDLQSPGGVRLLHAASLRGTAPIISLLLTNNAKVNVADAEGFTPLMVAALNGHTDAVRTLVFNRADPNATRLDSGETALHLAMNSNSRGVVTALLDAGADVNALTTDNSTPLHVAAELNAQHAAEALLQAPLHDLTIKNAQGHTAAEVGKLHGHVNMARLLATSDQVDNLAPMTQTDNDQGARVTVLKLNVVVGGVRPASEGVYKCTSRPRGHVLVINYHEFQSYSWRKGSPIDVANLENLFTKMGFKVTTHSDLSLEGTHNALNNFRSDGDLANVDSAFICVLSHGVDRETFLTSDDEKMTTNEVRNMFKDEACPLLKGKPKVFLFNFCRGQKLEKGCVLDVAQDAVSLGTTSSPTDLRSSPANPWSPSSIEVFKDMSTIYATVEGVQALRDEERGTFFVMALCEVFAANAHNKSLDELVTKVTERMIKHLSATTPETVNHAFKKFYINPMRPEHQ